MKPEYIENFIPSAFCYREALFFHLSQLSWLEVTEPRKEYFMSDTPVSYLYGTGQGKREYLLKVICNLKDLVATGIFENGHSAVFMKVFVPHQDLTKNIRSI